MAVTEPGPAETKFQPGCSLNIQPLPKKQSGNCGVAIAGWYSSKLGYSHYDKDKTIFGASTCGTTTWTEKSYQLAVSGPLRSSTHNRQLLLAGLQKASLYLEIGGGGHLSSLPTPWTNWEVNRFGEILGKSFRRRNITMQGTRTLYSGTMDGLKMVNLNEGINDLDSINIILMAVTISLEISILFFKKWFE